CRDQRNGEAESKTSSGASARLELATETLCSLTQPVEAASSSVRWFGAAVVLDLDRGAIRLGADADRAMHCVAGSDHVGRAFPDRPSEDGVDVCGERHVRVREVAVDAGGGECCARLLERVCEPELPVALHRLPHLRERCAADGLDVV